MKFSEAMQSLKEGNKVSRKSLKDDFYFLIVDGQVKSFSNAIRYYPYNADIMISGGWLISETGDFPNDEELLFNEIVNFLQKGGKAKLKHWVDSYITFDRVEKHIVICTKESCEYLPNFEDFLAEDWILL